MALALDDNTGHPLSRAFAAHGHRGDGPGVLVRLDITILAVIVLPDFILFLATQQFGGGSHGRDGSDQELELEVAFSVSYSSEPTLTVRWTGRGGMRAHG